MNPDLLKIWQKLETEKLEPARATVPTEWPPKSKHPVKKLERAFLLTLVMAVFFEGIFVYLFVHFNHYLVRTFLGLVILSYIFFFIINYKVYREIRTKVDFSTNLLEALRSIFIIVKTMLRFQSRTALFIYPISATAGFLMGFSAHADPSHIFDKPALWLSLLGVVTVLTPLSYLLAKWLEKISYGKYCQQLKELIKALESGSQTK